MQQFVTIFKIGPTRAKLSASIPIENIKDFHIGNSNKNIPIENIKYFPLLKIWKISSH